MTMTAQIRADAETYEDYARRTAHDSVLVARLIGAITSEMSIRILVPKPSILPMLNYEIDSGVTALFNEHTDAIGIIENERRVLVNLIRERYASDPDAHAVLRDVIGSLAKTMEPGDKARWYYNDAPNDCLRELQPEQPALPSRVAILDILS